MKKLLQISLFLLLCGITFSSATSDKGIIILFIRLTPVASPSEPPPPVHQCLTQVNDKMQSSMGTSYWALYQQSPLPSKLVTLDDLQGQTINQYIANHGSSSFVCIIIILIEE